MKCGNCGKEIETDQAIYGLSIDLVLAPPMGGKIEHESLWSSNPFCSMKCLQSSIIKILDDMNAWIQKTTEYNSLFKEDLLNTVGFVREQLNKRRQFKGQKKNRP